jgi:hypothetical protein
MILSLALNRSVEQITEIRLWWRILDHFIGDVVYTGFGYIDSPRPPSIRVEYAGQCPPANTLHNIWLFTPRNLNVILYWRLGTIYILGSCFLTGVLLKIKFLIFETFFVKSQLFSCVMDKLLSPSSVSIKKEFGPSLKIQAEDSSETQLPIYQLTRHHSP